MPLLTPTKPPNPAFTSPHPAGAAASSSSFSSSSTPPSDPLTRITALRQRRTELIQHLRTLHPDLHNPILTSSSPSEQPHPTTTTTTTANILPSTIAHSTPHPPSPSPSTSTSVSTSQQAQPHSQAQDPSQADITTALAAANKTVKTHISLLHAYNEMRDVGQGLLGQIAETRGVRVVDVMGEFGVGAED